MYAHPSHSFAMVEGYVMNVPQVEDNVDKIYLRTKTTRKKYKDAFYGNAKTKEERKAIDLAHQAGLARKSNDGLMADIQLAGHDITTRLTDAKRPLHVWIGTFSLSDFKKILVGIEEQIKRILSSR